MRIVLQRVSSARVESEGRLLGAIQKGFVVLVGIADDDSSDDADWLAAKIHGMRVFTDADGKMNLDLTQVGGSLLIVSQFTLHASTKKGNRPSFISAARPERAIPLYNYFVEKLETLTGKPCATGIFGGDMQIHLVNDGPVTICMDSKSKE